MMIKEEFFKYMDTVKINEIKVLEIEKIYETKLNPILKQLISCTDVIDFFDEERRLLSYAEIVDPLMNLEIDFNEKGLIPVVDAYDQDYIIYIIEEDMWAKYNAIDEVVFKKRKTFKEVV